MKKFFCVIICIFNIYLNLTVQAQNLTSKSLPKNLAVTLNYWQQTNGFLAYNEKLPSDCNIKSTNNKRTIICPAWVKITINKKQLLSWQQQQNKNGFINLYLPKIGILHEQAKITKIKKVIPQALTNKNQHLVTAVYMRYAHVLKYKIKDIDTGKTEEITTTPEHKFYETAYKKFMAISKLGPSNTITNASNHHLKIICTNNRQNNCGIAPLNSLQKVYNMEVDKTHNYFVGNMKVLVHNGCYDYYYGCDDCNKMLAEKNLFSKVCEKAENKKHFVTQIFQCRYCGIPHYLESTILNHIKEVHTGEFPIHCDICGGGFKSSDKLDFHSKVHEYLKNKLFCGKCNEMILVKDKRDGTHVHKSDLQAESDVEPHSRARSRSPIKDIPKNRGATALPSLDINLDSPDLS